MKNITRNALVPFSAKQMFELIDDIDSYQLFVPYCQRSTVLTRSEKQVIAELQVAKSGIAKSFTTKNTLKEYALIKMELVDGPFSHLSGNWTFIPLSDSACKIELELNFEFSNKLATLAFSKIFSQLVHSMVSAFTERAEQIYAK